MGQNIKYFKNCTVGEKMKPSHLWYRYIIKLRSFNFQNVSEVIKKPEDDAAKLE